LSSQKTLAIRVGEFFDLFKKKIELYNVTDIALETSFLGQNAQTFLKLGYLRGILYLLAAQNQLTLHEFAPREVKQSVTGIGSASKEQVALMVSRLFPNLNSLSQGVKSDVTDALAIGLCGVWAKQQKELFSRFK
jgi:crossover junction endodeoxyribonuclease RuvC